MKHVFMVQTDVQVNCQEHLDSYRSYVGKARAFMESMPRSVMPSCWIVVTLWVILLVYTQITFKCLAVWDCLFTVS